MSDDIRAEAGFLILADISGFTAFVAGTELEHGALVTGVLLEAVMRRLSPPLEIQELARVAGPDVILVHRLLKNPVNGSAYLLLTASALERVGVDPVASRMQQHFVSYPHLGEVPCFVADLEPLARPDFAAAPVLAA